MADFTLDTSGAIRTGYDAILNRPEHAYWSSLSPFEQGYIAKGLEELQALLDTRRYGLWLRVRFDLLAPSTLAAIRKDCAAMAALILGLDARDGRDIWTARQKGFPGTGTVTEYMRRNFPPLTITLGDDGRVYQREAQP